MQKLLKYPLFVIILLLALPACKTARNAGKTKLKAKSSKFVLKRLSANRFEADWLSAKTRITYKDDYQTRKFTANLILKKDSLIWMNVKKLSVEAARIMITPDSVYLIDRMNKEYAIHDLGFIERAYQIPTPPGGEPTTFEVLQQVILGNPVFFAGSGLESSVNDDAYHLDGNHGSFDSRYQVDGLKFLLTRMLFQENNSEQNLSFSYAYSDDKEDYPNFSYFREINMYSKETGEVSLDIKFSKLEINRPKSIRFEIPEHYTKQD